MDAERCIYCREIIPEGRDVCDICEHKIMKMGRLLQSMNATDEEIQKAYEDLRKELSNDASK